MNGSRPTSEQLGRRRFPDDKRFRTDLLSRSSLVLNSLLDLFASNYPKSENTNLAQLLRVLARESGRLRYDIDALNADKVYTRTRPQFLQQVLGERLFLRDRIAPEGYNDETYRRYLIAIKDAYLRGSTKETIEGLASLFTGQQIRVKELYLEARKPDSSYDVTDTHKMIVDVMVDNLMASGFDYASFASNLQFFIDLVRPAHVLYDTRFIWSETIYSPKIDVLFGDPGGGCVPVYAYKPLGESVVLARKVMVLPGSYGATSRIGSVHNDDSIFFLDDETRVIVEPGVEGTVILNSAGKRVPLSALKIGQYIAMEFITIPGDFQFWWLPPEIAQNINSRFTRSIFRLPAFQENVKKVMDSHGRFPLQVCSTATAISDRWVQDALQPLYEDLRRNCSERSETAHTYDITLSERMGSPRFSFDNLQGVPLGREVSGDIFSFQIPNIPLTDGSGSPATPSDIAVLKDGTALVSAVEMLDASTGAVGLYNTNEYWDQTGGGVPIIGDTLQFRYWYLQDGTDQTASTDFVFGIARWQLPQTPVASGSGTNTLAQPGDVGVFVDGTAIPDAVAELNPIFGHVTLENTTDFWTASPLGRLPAVGDTIRFSYYESGVTTYAMLYDDLARIFDDDMIFDGAEGAGDPTREPAPRPEPLTIGYRYRAYHLHHTSVLNSPDTLLLNNYQKPAKRASLANHQDSLNHHNLFFSPEFLTDTTANITLDDQYLENGLDPVLKLSAGTPPFQKTFGYQPDLVYHRKLKDIRIHRHPLMYSDLLLKEFQEGDDSVPLSSICDSAGYTFKFRYRETLDQIEECEPWILFDTLVTEFKQFFIPGESRGVPNLRISGKQLRKNFILRQREPNQTFLHTHVVETGDVPQTLFQLPDTILYTSESDGIVDFPALPIMKNATTIADPGDVTVKLDGVTVEGLVKSLNPLTGAIELYLPDTFLVTEHISLTEEDIARGWHDLLYWPLDPEDVALNVVRGATQYYGTDFFVVEDRLHWSGSPIELDLIEGDVLRVVYSKAPLVGTRVEFIYRLLGTGDAEVVSRDLSRIYDYTHVFPGSCYDEYKPQTQIKYNEYVNFLDDYSSGIKIVYFNKDTYQLEEHVFSGPVFETYDVRLDQVSCPESFPNALVRVRNPIHSENPLTMTTDYNFILESQIRIRRKVFRELLPDRSFRTMEITEALPV